MSTNAPKGSSRVTVAGQLGHDAPVLPHQAGDEEGHRLPHPGQQGDFPGGAVLQAHGAFPVGHDGVHLPQPEAEVVAPVAAQGDALQHDLPLHGGVQPLQ
ncbi:MAG: hypothetical protein LUD83_10715 [Clostridiales bacterium]|nr:hypothetical protein [Clostridiales bacterium]